MRYMYPQVSEPFSLSHNLVVLMSYVCLIAIGINGWMVIRGWAIYISVQMKRRPRTITAPRVTSVDTGQNSRIVRPD